MKSFRLERLQNEIKKIFNNALSTKLNDPRLEWVIISAVEVSKDLNYAKVHFTHYNNPLTHEQLKEILNKASGFFKKQIAGAKLMRTIPELTFFYDETEERAARIDSLLATVKNDSDDDDYDPDIDIEDYLDEDEYFDFDDEDFDDIDDIDDEDED